eukprot:COSAG06_NODE_70288_length_193_cov_13.553191_1_plen_29_part_10
MDALPDNARERLMSEVEYGVFLVSSINVV